MEYIPVSSQIQLSGTTYLSGAINSQDDGRCPVCGRFCKAAVGRSQAGAGRGGGGLGIPLGSFTDRKWGRLCRHIPPTDV